MPHLKQSVRRFLACRPSQADHSLLLTLFRIALIASACSTAVTAQGSSRISDVTFRGNNSFSDQTLLNELSISIPNWFSKKFQGARASTVNLVRLEEYSDALQRFYQREGFLYVSVLPPIAELDESENVVRLIVEFNERQPVRIDKRCVRRRYKLTQGRKTRFNLSFPGQDPSSHSPVLWSREASVSPKAWSGANALDSPILALRPKS